MHVRKIPDSEITSRPARPARCIAEDFVISLVSRVSKPEVEIKLAHVVRDVWTSTYRLQPSELDIVSLYTFPCL
jgi:hypothetical protein